jgi:hypothetical protein
MAALEEDTFLTPQLIVKYTVPLPEFRTKISP